MQKWMIRNVKADTLTMAKALSVEEIIARLLVNREIYDLEECHKFINPSLEYLLDAGVMADMEKAVLIMKKHIDEGKNILIVGDYDVDGVISSYILYKGLTRLKAKVTYHIPDRITEGYGININIIDKAKENKIDLIITCDNGIAALEQIKYAKSLGISVIITDHHDIPFIEKDEGIRNFVIPEGDAVINPKRLDCAYAFKKLCGAGIAFKFIEKLYEAFSIDKKEAYKFIEYAAIATVCDVVDLIGENRVIVKKGLEMINNTTSLGLRALIEETGIKGKTISAYHLGFIIGPCINATGRLESAVLSLKLLLSEDIEEAKDLASKLHALNAERQELTNEGLLKAIDDIEKKYIEDSKVLVVYIPEIHESIAGIIAGRIRERYNLPSIVLTKAKEGVKGSGRSIEGYNMFEELLKCKEVLEKFGGHPMAAGLSLKEENIEKLRKNLNDNCTLSEEDRIPKVLIDTALPFKNITLDLVEKIQCLEPYGKGNSKPIFAEKNITILRANIIGKNKNVIKLYLGSRDGKLMEGILFNEVDRFESFIIEEFGEEELSNLYLGARNSIMVDMVFTLDINEYMDRKSIQVQIRDFRKSR